MNVELGESRLLAAPKHLMKHHRFGLLLAGLVLLGTALLAPKPASAQMAAGVPDLSDFAGAIAKSAQTAPTATAKADLKKATVFKTDLAVPRVKPGSGASEIGRMFRVEGVKAGGPEAALKEIEAAMPKILVAVEGELTKNKFAPRDMGVAMGVSIMQLYKDATATELSDDAETVATKSFASAVAKNWGPNFKKLAPAAQEQMYEKILMSTALNSMLISQFAEAGKTDEADSLRAASGEMFEKLVGVPALEMKVAADGRISGLAPDKK